jgi:N-methylhydantoinase A
VNLRLAIVGAGPNPEIPAQTVTSSTAEPQKIVSVYAGGYRDVPLYARETLSPGTRLQGPAIVSQEDTTLIIPQDCSAEVDPASNIVVHFEGPAHD